MRLERCQLSHQTSLSQRRCALHQALSYNKQAHYIAQNHIDPIGQRPVLLSGTQATDASNLLRAIQHYTLTVGRAGGVGVDAVAILSQVNHGVDTLGWVVAQAESVAVPLCHGSPV